MIQQYVDKMAWIIADKISKEIKNDTTDDIGNYIKGHFEDKKLKRFHEYYMETVNNTKRYLTQDFYRNFKTQYSLQGISNEYLQYLEKNKVQILDRIQRNKLLDLYFEYFANPKINSRIEGSFFSKLVHTFKPSEFCALDNPIKDYFNLKPERFLVAFLIVSKAYTIWATENQPIIQKIRKCLTQTNGISDLKLLDMIYWRKANLRKKELSR